MHDLLLAHTARLHMNMWSYVSLTSKNMKNSSLTLQDLLKRSIVAQLEARAYAAIDEPVQMARDQVFYARNFLNLNIDNALIELSNTFLPQPMIVSYVWFDDATQTGKVKTVNGGDRIRRKRVDVERGASQKAIMEVFLQSYF